MDEAIAALRADLAAAEGKLNEVETQRLAYKDAMDGFKAQKDKLQVKIQSYRAAITALGG